MSYRFTNTEKWGDAWFSNLSQIQMLLFIYLCDNCDIAGFIEINYKRWSTDLSSSADTIQGACKGLSRGLVFSKDGDCIFIKNFLKHQKNLPLNNNNKAHIGILKRFVVYNEKFDIQDINSFIEGASKGLPSPTGNGNGNGNGKFLTAREELWRNDFEIYLAELNTVYEKLIRDEMFIKQQEEFNPNVDIPLTLKKAVTNFWGKPAGWKNKKASKTAIIDWKATLTNAIGINKVYKQKPASGISQPKINEETYKTPAKW